MFTTYDTCGWLSFVKGLSEGEPAMRDDLPEIISMTTRMEIFRRFGWRTMEVQAYVG